MNLQSREKTHTKKCKKWARSLKAVVFSREYKLCCCRMSYRKRTLSYSSAQPYAVSNLWINEFLWWLYDGSLWGKMTAFFVCSVAQLCLTLCDPMNCSMPGFPVLSPRACSNSCPLSRWCIQPSHSLSSPSFWPSIFSSIRVFSNELALHIRPRK